jgi:signal transduction histidine kinase
LTLLLLLTLAAIGVFVYGTTFRAIEAKQNAAKEKIDLQFAEQRDEALLTQARLLASEAQSLLDPKKLERQWAHAHLTLLTPPTGPYSHVQIPIFLMERVPSPLSFRLHMALATELTLNDLEAGGHGYIQINGDWGQSWRSHDLKEPLGFDPAQFGTNSRQRGPDWGTLDDVEITPGITARRVRLKAPLMRFVRPDPVPEFPQVNRAAVGITAHAVKESLQAARESSAPDVLTMLGRGMFARNPQRGPPIGPQYRPAIYIQCAWDRTTDHPQWIEMQKRHEEQIKDIEKETQRTLASIRNNLLMIGGISIVVVLLASWFVIAIGLKPLHRLSDAVSRVSAKDFRLPIDSKILPQEVVPIVERLRSTLAALQNAFAREKRATADISHELRTPLAALTTTLEVALRKPRSPEEYRLTLEDSREIARQLSALVERILMLAWLDAGADVVKAQEVHIAQLMRGCAAIGKPLAEAQGLKFNVSVDVPVTIQTDPDKLREVVMNLMHNAIEYNQPGGTVELTAQVGPSGHVVVEVRDTGIGIPTELQDKIFERFYRGDPSRNAVGVHAGLGLAIVKEYVDRLGGTLDLQSTVGQGSRFRVELPGS